MNVDARRANTIDALDLMLHLILKDCRKIKKQCHRGMFTTTLPSTFD